MQIVIVLSNSFVGREHHAFNHAFTHTTFAQHNVNWVSCVVHDDFGFIFFEVNGTTRVPHLVKHFMQLRHFL